VFDAISIIQPCVLTSAVHQGEACALLVVLIICIVALLIGLLNPVHYPSGDIQFSLLGD